MGTTRVLLALAVVFAHVPAPFGIGLTGASLAVQMFYVISGFYMALVLTEKYPANSDGRRRFWLNRVLRLAPCYYAVLAITLFMSLQPFWTENAPANFAPALLTWRKHALHMGWPAKLFYGITNLTVLGQDMADFTAVDPSSGSLVFAPVVAPAGFVAGWKFMVLPQSWTLSLELMFYALAPWLVRRSSRWLTIAVAASVLVRLSTYAVFGRNDPWTYRFFPSELGLFILGVLAYRWHARLESGLGPSDLPRIARAVTVCAILGIVIFSHASQIVIVAAFAFVLPWLFRETAKNPLDRWIGELSYPVYLGHLLIAPLAGYWLGFTSTSMRSLATGALALLFAAAFHAGVERPMDRLRQRRFGASRPAPS